MNTIETFADCGRKAAQALNQRDQSRYAFHRDWYRRALALEEAGQPRIACAQAYEEAFRATRNVPRVEHFR